MPQMWPGSRVTSVTFGEAGSPLAKDVSPNRAESPVRNLLFAGEARCPCGKDTLARRLCLSSPTSFLISN
jgi:hypothetical protein